MYRRVVRGPLCLTGHIGNTFSEHMGNTFWHLRETQHAAKVRAFLNFCIEITP
jgi:hypothetical protein